MNDRIILFHRVALSQASSTQKEKKQINLTPKEKALFSEIESKLASNTKGPFKLDKVDVTGSIKREEFVVPEKPSTVLLRKKASELARICIASHIGIPQTTVKENSRAPGLFTFKRPIAWWIDMNWTQSKALQKLMAEHVPSSLLSANLSSEEQKIARDARFPFHKDFKPSSTFSYSAAPPTDASSSAISTDKAPTPPQEDESGGKEKNDGGGDEKRDGKEDGADGGPKGKGKGLVLSMFQK